MAYAADIINDTFDKTKQLFFPIKLKYWLRMGLVSFFSGSSSGGSGSNYSSGSRGGRGGDIDIRQAVSTFNSCSAST